MKRKHWFILGAALLLGLAGVSSGAAQSASNTVVNWWVMAGGGAPASAGTVSLNSTLGQPITGGSASSDGSIALGAGYWPDLALSPIVSSTYAVYLPIVQY
jgi:hypothetical protein